MHGDGTRYSIGELARLTGLSVRTVRFYSDSGVVPPAGRTEAGYRLYDAEALARLELVRTLRELGVDLATIRRVLARELGCPTSPPPTRRRSTPRSARCACAARCCG